MSQADRLSHNHHQLLHTRPPNAQPHLLLSDQGPRTLHTHDVLRRPQNPRNRVHDRRPKADFLPREARDLLDARKGRKRLVGALKTASADALEVEDVEEVAMLLASATDGVVGCDEGDEFAGGQVEGDVGDVEEVEEAERLGRDDLAIDRVAFDDGAAGLVGAAQREKSHDVKFFDDH